MNERTLPEVHQDYSNICAKAGHIQFQISQLTKDLVLMNSQLLDLNFEGAKINEKTAANKVTEDLAKAAASVKADAITPSDAQVVS